jgi:hypothetical protein
MAHLLGWVILLFQPRWVFLFAFTAAIIALSSPLMFSATDQEGLIVAAIMVFANGAVFMAIGGPIVALRKWLQSRKSKSDKDVDAELVRIRAEAAAREGAVTPPAN